MNGFLSRVHVRSLVAALVSQHRRQPLLGVAALFLAGIVGGYRGGFVLAALTGAAICAGALSMRRLRGGARVWISAALIFLLGWSRAAWDLSGRTRESEIVQTLDARQTFVCRVGPEIVVTPLKGAAAKYSFRAERLRTEDGAFAVGYLPVQVQWFGARQSGATQAPHPGETWRVAGRAAVKKGRDRLPMLTVNTGEDRSKRLAPADPEAWAVRIDRARRQAARRLAIGIEDWDVVPRVHAKSEDEEPVALKGIVAGLNQAMMLGCRSEIPYDMRRVFANSGTIHIFAISGLNIALVAGLLIVVVSALGIPRPYWVVGLAPLLIFYTLASGAQPSAIRACLMAIIYFAAPLIGRRSSGSVALAATALIVYAQTPALVYNIGCTLSFAVMGGLLVFCRPFCELGRDLCRVRSLVQRGRLYEQAGNGAAARAVRWSVAGLGLVIDSVAVSLAAWLASLPLTAYYFARFTPGGFFANLVIAPCAFLVMVAGSLGLVTSLVSDGVASCFNHAAGFFTVIMIRTAEVTAECPWGNFRVTRWLSWQVWGWFLALAALAVWLYVRQTKRNDGLDWLESDETER